MPLRLLNRTVQIVLDVAILSLAYWLAFLFRLEFSIPPVWLRVLLVTWPYVVILQYAALAAFGVPRLSWRYISIGDMTRVLSAVSLATVVMTLIRLGGPLIGPHLSILIIPLG